MSDQVAGTAASEVLADAGSNEAVRWPEASRWAHVPEVGAAIALALAFVASDLAVSAAGGDPSVDLNGLTWFSVLVMVLLAGLHVYDRRSVEEPRVGLPGAITWLGTGRLMAIGTWAFLAVAALANGIREPRGLHLIAFAAFGLLFTATGRGAVRTLERRWRGAQNAVIVGAGEVGQLVARKLLRHPEYGINVVGFLDDAPPARWRQDVAQVPLLGEVDDLAAVTQRQAVDRVIVAFSKQRDQGLLDRVRPVADMNVRVDVVPRLFEMIGPGAGLPEIEGVPLVAIPPRSRPVAAAWMKRGIDIAGATLALILAAPVFLWAWWRIPRDSPGPVFFRQTRLGRDMQEFTMLKFRTMITDADESSHRDYVERAMNAEQPVAAGELYKLDSGEVVTATGRLLRRTSLDELPQLINVLQGTMSLVGPRPCLPYETAHFSDHHYERFSVPPGMTGLWQVTARANASFPEALEMDVAYVRHWSLGFDLSLMFRTPVEVIRQRRSTV
jgi:exopolysaccharide biosynthesis polyprenyl glycosylphosphotransferase